MPNPLLQLQYLHQAGYEIQSFDRYPRHVGVVRGNCIALLEVTPDGLHMIGAPGWRMGEVMGVLIEKDGRQIFQAKEQIQEATPERLNLLRRFGEELERDLAESARKPSPT